MAKRAPAHRRPGEASPGEAGAQAVDVKAQARQEPGVVAYKAPLLVLSARLVPQPSPALLDVSDADAGNWPKLDLQMPPRLSERLGQHDVPRLE